MNANAPAGKIITQETVTSLRRWTDSLLTFTTTKPPGYSFTAGQYARLGLADERGMIWRAYSMTSAPHEEELEFYGIIVPGGLFTTRLDLIQPGDQIDIESQTYGFMTVDRFTGGEDLWMLATGTGVGPYLSILRDPEVWGRFRRLILVHCVRHAEEFAYKEELAELQRRPPSELPADQRAELRILRSTTREQTEPGEYLHGRITTLLESGELERAAGRPLNETDSRIMMCGNPQMIEDMRHILHRRGMRPVRRALPGQFVTENYW